MSLCALLSDPSCANVDSNDTTGATATVAAAVRTSEDGTEHGPISYNVPEKDPYFSTEVFVLKSSPAADRTTSLLVYPETLLPRSCLPLCCLESHCGAASWPLDQPVFANIEALEKETSSGVQHHNASVLIVRIDGHTCLYVLERIRRGAYTIRKLRPWVKASHLQALPSRSIKRYQPEANNQNDINAGPHWWASALLTDSTRLPRKRRRIDGAGEAAIQPDAADRLAPEPKNNDPIEPSDEISATCAVETVEDDISSMVDETYGIIVQQYLEALYLSKAPLTYFAKGPLSRARARVSQDVQIFPQYISTLAERLRFMVSSVNMIDKKYRDTLPELIKLRALPDVTKAQRAGSYPLPRQKRRKSKKHKLGKDGLFGIEEDYLLNWWSLDDTHCGAMPSSDDFETLAKQIFPALKFRENLLQIIISLEILALEGSLAKTNTQGSSLNHSTREEGERTKTKPKSKGSKIQDITFYLDALVDRLCIWQTTSGSNSNETKNDQLALDDGLTTQAEVVRGTDELKEFCVDVVVPFYGGRLPHVVEKLGKTLGIKLGPSPNKRPPSKMNTKTNRLTTETGNRTSSDVRKHGNSVPKKPKIHAPTALPVVSGGDGLLQSIKRERSTTPQLSLKLKPERRPFSRTSSLSQSRSFQKREVDFSAINKFNETKSKKKAKIEQELHDAIATLKKPNRVSAVKEYFNEKDQRTAMLPTKVELKPQRKPTPLDIQVDATPKKGVAQFEEAQSSILAGSEPASGDLLALLSSNANIPGSVIRPPAFQPAPHSHGRSGISSNTSPRIDVFDTPSKPSRFLKPPMSRDAVLASSPALRSIQHETSLAESPSVPVQRSRYSNSMSFKVDSTPSKKQGSLFTTSRQCLGDSKSTTRNDATQSIDVQADPTRSRPCDEHDPEQTIYERLGWMDDDDDIL